jgi:release factor glutamine methyltransferase
MSVSLSSQPLAAVVGRLRAAGCVFAEDEAELIMSAAGSPAEVGAMVDRRVSGLPLEQVIGWAEFCGLRIAVASGVFVPRRRSEFLVRLAASLATRRGSPGAGDAAVPAGTAALPGTATTAGAAAPAGTVVVDLCCGSGALGVAVAAALGGAELHAADIDPGCARCARRNVAAFGGRVYQGDLFEPLPAALRGRVDVLLANAPYVPTEGVGLLPPEAREHEPLVALDGGADGLDVLRRIAGEAPDWLAPGGHLLVETSEGQAPRMARAMSRAGLLARVAGDQELAATAVIGTRPAR